MHRPIPALAKRVFFVDLTVALLFGGGAAYYWREYYHKPWRAAVTDYYDQLLDSYYKPSSQLPETPAPAASS